MTLIGEGEGSSARAAVYGLRHRLSRGIETALPEPPASLAQALLLGERGRLPQDVTEEFRSSGTSHLLAISGLHIGVVLALVLGISSWLFGKRRQVYLLLPLGSIWLYAVLSGLSPSVERAAIMGSVYLLALAIGRPRSVLPGLALAAGVMAGFDPKILKQVSFQLSFAAVTGLALLNISDLRLWDRFLPATAGGLRSLLARAVITVPTVSVVATLATVPLVAFHLHRVPTLGILATMLALPALPFLLVTSAAAGAVGSTHTQAGEMVGWVAWVPLQYVLEVVHLVSRVPGNTFNVGAFSGLLVWVYYGILLALVLNPKGVRGAWAALRILTPGGDQAKVEGAQAAVRRHLPLGASVVGAIALGVVGTLLWLYATSGPDGKLHVHFLDVGQGDSTLIVTPEGRQVLIDGGPGTTDATHALGERLLFWDRDLDMVVLTHPDEDHFLGLVEVLDRYDVGIVMEGGGASDNRLYIEWEKELEQGTSRRFAAAQGQTVLLDGATWMQVLNPPGDGPRQRAGASTNNQGAVLRLVHGSVSFLLTVDIEAEAERRLFREETPLRSSVLKVGHHGSKTSTTPGFLSEVSPAAAVISAGVDNRFGHPHVEVAERLAAAVGGPRVYLTADRGHIEFISDGERLWVKTER